MGKIRWYAGSGKHFYSPMGHYYARLEDGTEIEVHPKTYDEQFHAYLERIGVQRTSWYTIMQQAAKEWNEYCQVMDAFAEDLQQWLEYQARGVVVERPHKLGANKGEAMTHDLKEKTRR